MWIKKYKRWVIVALILSHVVFAACELEGGNERPSSPCIGNCN